MCGSISILVLLVALFMPAAVPLSFDMSPISPSYAGKLNLTGDAHFTGEALQLTTNAREPTNVGQAGRATYLDLLHLWDRVDFSTHFSIEVDASGTYNCGDGLTFFLAPQGSSIKPNSYGSGLGLKAGDGASPVDPSSLDRFVAVEFDTYYNDQIDPVVWPHVGIDLNNNMSSVITVPWFDNTSAVVANDVSVTYNATTNILSVNFTGDYHGSLSYKVDLRDHLPEYVTVGFSAASGSSCQTNTIKSWKFSSTVMDGNHSKNRRALIIGLPAAAISLLLILALGLIFFFLSKKYKKEKEVQLSDSTMDDEFEMANGPKRFSYSDLLLATNHFAADQKLGEGGFGSVYKGFLKATNTLIAVKKVSEGSKQGRKEYEAEVKIISRLRHMNLVELIGWCHRREEFLLVYEFMPKGSLDSHLFKLNSLLTWEIRYRIAQGIASALLYLHEELRQYVVHRDIKSSNVMLDNNFNAKLGDFGLARLVDHDKDLHSTAPAGTRGYMAPEYIAEGRASKETDIYSLGIVLLEIGCGRRAIELKYPQGQIMLVKWVWSLYGAGNVLDAADPKLESVEDDVHKIERLMVVGLWCGHPDSSKRPTIRQVNQVLISEEGVPDLPRAMPKAVSESLLSS